MLMLGQLIKEHRKKANLTQAELGKLLGVGRSTVARYESNTIRPPMKTLTDMQSIFKDDFLDTALYGEPFSFEKTYEYRLIAGLCELYMTGLQFDDDPNHVQYSEIVTEGLKRFIVSDKDLHQFYENTVEHLSIAFKHFLLDKGTYQGQYKYEDDDPESC